MSALRPDSEETVRLLERSAGGDAAALDDLLDRHREAVRAFVAIRLDARTKVKEDPSDIANQVLTECALRFEDYLRRRPMPFQLWVRATAREVAIKARRKWRAQCRNVDREMNQPDTSSLALAQSIVGNGPSPVEEVQSRELAERVANAIDALDEDDREILMLRQVDDLAHKEIAIMLDISEVNARQRYGRALINLQKELKKLGVTGGGVE